MLPKWKEELLWIKETHSQVLQQVMLNMDTAYKNFLWKRTESHRFKNKHAAKHSVSAWRKNKRWILGLSSKSRIDEGSHSSRACWHDKNRGDLHVINWKIFCLHSDRWRYWSNPTISHIKTIEAIDVGIKDLVITSSGWKSGNQKHLAHVKSNLRRKQKSLSRKIEAAKSLLDEFKADSQDKGFRLSDSFGSNIKKNSKRVALFR